jgi:hypothetical protein
MAELALSTAIYQLRLVLAGISPIMARQPQLCVDLR